MDGHLSDINDIKTGPEELANSETGRRPGGTGRPGRLTTYTHREAYTPRVYPGIHHLWYTLRYTRVIPPWYTLRYTRVIPP